MFFLNFCQYPTRTLINSHPSILKKNDKIPMVLRFKNPWSVMRDRPLRTKQILYGTLSEEIR